MEKIRKTVDDPEQLRSVKRERLRADTNQDSSAQQGNTERRVIRSQYLAVFDEIKDKRDDLERLDSEKFNRIFSKVEELHRKVSKPREQVADAEALLDITNTLMNSVKSHSNEGTTPSGFVFRLIRDFGQSNGGMAVQDNAQNLVCWKDIGLAVSPIFRKAYGCCTMLGPMNVEFKHRKTAVHRRREKSTVTARPEELDDTQVEEKTDTDNNMSTMFGVLRKNRHIRLENLILNRNSFAQTVENLFALSFLVKDGRAEIAVDASGSHIVYPRNAPDANSIMSGEVIYRHFVFRCDFIDWKLMMDIVPVGEELMPHRLNSIPSDASRTDIVANSSHEALPSTPIRKLSRNQGRVVTEESVIEIPLKLRILKLQKPMLLEIVDADLTENIEAPKACCISIFYPVLHIDCLRQIGLNIWYFLTRRKTSYSYV